MIFVTIGSAEPFDRLLRALEQLPGDERVIVQGGATTLRPSRFEIRDFMAFDELVAQVRAARVVVSHAGVGTILAVRACGKRPVVVPRLRRLGEAVDDHQLDFARRLADLNQVVLVENLAELPALLGGDIDGGDAGPLDSRLVQELRSVIVEHAGRPRRAAAKERS